MQISAINKLTLLDFPGKTSAIIFTAGCNMRCGYCHNSQFVLPEKIDEIKWDFIPFEIVLNFLKTRIWLLDWVVISGGEPTLQLDLIEKIKEIKNLWFKIKLDTNWTNPVILKKLLDKNLLDYVAMDIKANPKNYEELTWVKINFENIKKSIFLLKNSKINYEFRSTILPKFHSIEDLFEMWNLIKWAKKWALQNFRNTSVLDKKFSNFYWFEEKEFKKLKEKLSSFVESFELRK